MTDATFHTATQEELHTMLEWGAQEGWNPGLEDAAAFFAADPDGFFVARVGGQMVAAISVVNHDESMAFLGLYLCRPAFRGRGIGYALWQHALSHAGARCVGLDGVASQQANYAKSGFVTHGATTRFEGSCLPVSTDQIRPANQACDGAAIARLDQDANGHLRSRFLSGWIADGLAGRKTVVARQEGEIAGFATARLCREGAKIGPIVASDTQTALSLMCAAADAVGAKKLIADVPGTQQQFRSALEHHGFEATFETARMYRGTGPQVSPTAMAIATMELG